MHNKTFEIPFSDINSMQVIEIDTAIEVKGKKVFPLEFQIINDCGGDISYNVIQSEDEYKLYKKNPDSFTFVRLKNDYYLTDDAAGKPWIFYKLLIRGLDGKAKSNLIIELMNYPYNPLMY